MSYIDKNLINGERIIYRAKKHWIIFAIPIILFLIAFMFLIGGKNQASIGILLSLISIIWVISSFISFKTSEFGVTNKRVLIKVGLIKRNSLEILLTKVESIHVVQGITGRMLNYGRSGNQVMHTGMKYNECSSLKAVTVVPAKSQTSDTVIPCYALQFRAGGGWVNPYWNISMLPSPRQLSKADFGLFMPLQIDDKTIDYNFEFQAIAD